MSESKCKGCGKKVIWAVDENGTKQILDAVAPVYQLSESQNPENDPVQRCARAKTAYVSHFVTCPQRAMFGKGAKG